jgi:drug/metabolite transporter (DMT)-like permease
VMAVSASVAYSVATPVARAAILSGFDPNALLVARMILATSLLLLTMLATNRRHLVSDRRCFLLSFGAGALNGFGMICYFQGLTLIESSMAAMIITMSPLVVLTLLALRGERFTYRHFVRLGLALAGAYLLIGPGGEVNLLGVLYVMIAILSFALQLVLIQWFLRPYPARTVTFYQLIAMTMAGGRLVVAARGGVGSTRSARMDGGDRLGRCQHLCRTLANIRCCKSDRRWTDVDAGTARDPACGHVVDPLSR